MSSNKFFKTGNVSSILPSRTHLLLHPSTITYDVSKGNDNFTYNNSTNQAVEPFEVSTGITSDSPEILAFSDFIPVYDDQGNLNKVGQFFQAKQDSKLISANYSISSAINSDLLISSSDETKLQIKNFCNDFGKNIDDLISSFLKVKRSLDCRSPFDDQNLKLAKLSKDNSNSLDGKNSIDVSPISIENLLFDSTVNNIANWTPTKVWIQSCLELKESFKNGTSGPLLSAGIIPPVQTTALYSSPYNIAPSNSSVVKKFNFNDKQETTPVFTDIPDKITPVTGDSEIYQKIKSLFLQNGIFNKSYFSSTDNIAESISRLSYILCKEYAFSTKMNTTILSEYGYVPDSIGGNGNLKVWDYLFGQTGVDITDISSSPLGGGKSLISLSQSIEADATEVLSFEDNYIKDNIGTKRPNAVLTPGTYYYIESSVNSSADGFDVSRINSYLAKLTSTTNMLEMLKSNLAFKIDVIPYTTPTQKALSSVPGSSNILTKKNVGIRNESYSPAPRLDALPSASSTSTTNSSSSSSKSVNFAEIEASLSNPISLLRFLENKILAGSDLLIRTSGGPRSRSGASPNTTAATDVSGLIISAAVKDPELMSLLFMHQSCLARPTKNIDTIISTLVETFVNKIKEKCSKSSDYGQVSEESLKFVLMNNPPGAYSNMQILLNIANCLNSLNVYFNKLEESTSITGKFFLSGNNADKSIDKKSFYSGIQKTTYLAAIFELCCLLVHSANFEEIKSISSAYSGDIPPVESVFRIEKTLNPVIPNNRASTIQSVRTPTDVVTLQYDKTIVECEQLLNDYNLDFLKRINRFYAFIFSLQKDLESLRNRLAPDLTNFAQYGNFLKIANDIIQDSNLTRLLMSEEQLLLIRSKLFDIQKRSSDSYSSPIKQSIPYFLNLKDNQKVENFLPIEDVHLVSWNLFLKSFLTSAGFRERDGFNKKIISVGIPQKICRRLWTSASSLKGSSDRKNKLVKINLYKVNALKPELVYLPLKYFFDLGRFQTRVLQHFIDSGFSISGNQNFELKNIPILKSKTKSEMSPSDSFSLINNQLDSFNDYALSDKEKAALINNHSISFLMEEYLRYISGTPFDENRYYKYEMLNQSPSSTGVLGSSNVDPSVEKFFSEETFLIDLDQLKKSLITPRKFDRVFHIIFDPDDFQIDEMLTSSEAISKYNADKIKRATSDEITFDKYYAAIETYDETGSNT